MTAAEIIARLEGAKSSGPLKWRARCPVHGGKSFSLSIEQQADRVLMHCFAECSTLDVLEAIGLRLADLFDETTRHQYVEGNRNARHTINPRDALALLEIESIVTMLAASDALKAREPLNAADVERVAQANDRIAAVMELIR